MKNYKNYKMKKILFVLSTIIISSGINAQDLVINLTGGTSEIFPISNVRSLKFESCEIIVYAMDGVANSFNIEDIDNYTFYGIANLDDIKSNENFTLNIFPNPASDFVNITFINNEPIKISIDVIDSKGQIISEIFNGIHNGEHTYLWDKIPSNGSYFVRIKNNKDMLTKKIIIK